MNQQQMMTSQNLESGLLLLASAVTFRLVVLAALVFLPKSTNWLKVNHSDGQVFF